MGVEVWITLALMAGVGLVWYFVHRSQPDLPEQEQTGTGQVPEDGSDRRPGDPRIQE